MSYAAPADRHCSISANFPNPRNTDETCISWHQRREREEKQNAPVSRDDPSTYVCSPMVTITAGKDRVTSFAHKALLEEYSPYFQACLGLNFQEAENQMVRFGDDDAKAIPGFLKWLYTGNFEEGKYLAEYCMKDFIDLYILADRLSIPQLRNDLVDHWRHYLRDGKYLPTGHEILAMHEHDILDQPAGRFILRLVAWSIVNEPDYWVGVSPCSMRQPFTESLNALYQNPDAAAKLLPYMVRCAQMNMVDPRYDDDCDYHEHPDGEKCKKPE